MSNRKNHYDVTIIGLGYVGLTLGACMAKTGLKILGVEKREDVVSLTNQGIPHFYESGLNDILIQVTKQGYFKAVSSLETQVSSNTYIITVGTPLDTNGQARLDMIRQASQEVADNMPENALVVLRSTVKVETTRKIVMPILEASGKCFDIAMCPERTLEGKALTELYELPQIIGADTHQTRNRAADLFGQLTKSVIQVESLESAEIIKLVDNTYRDVQFAFANEIARACEVFGVDAYEVITSGKQGYARTNVPLPGPVGGPCLEKDPHILAQSAKEKGINLEITQASRLVNERQPHEIVAFIQEQLSQRQFPTNCKIALLGMAFKGTPAIDDLRGSMAIHLLKQLQQQFPQGQITLFDPEIELNTLKQNFPTCQIANSRHTAIKDAACVIIANNHPQLYQDDISVLSAMLSPNGFIYDCWNGYSHLPVQQLKNHYYAIGRTISF